MPLRNNKMNAAQTPSRKPLVAINDEDGIVKFEKSNGRLFSCPFPFNLKKMTRLSRSTFLNRPLAF